MSRPIFILVIIYAISAQLLMAQVTPRRSKPNTTINETLIDYGRTYQKAEDAVLQKAKLKAYDGEYELKNIGLGGRDDEHYCIIEIQHEIFRPQNRRTIDEVTVGYGRTMAMAEIDARYKAERMINERLNSAKERRARQAAAEAARQRDSAALGKEEPIILDKDDDTSYILKSIRFSGRSDDYQCYIKFEYLVMK
ncbi:hypothetical protein [Cerasicoccus arenae]|uniref:Uncharacterized protein n=1 Tax=Cerasicoccus arenae TaxID=424488 RepID=A0A8J3GFM6_9BACT|nr:hypothetical protein [Cerasicoccus arenae]MBK1859791.1 hypothetical protein [Cerasicoccus arenae]GHC13186.1 hypothetical protein GCM10007047_33130 [Cerasicoccus arenae]